MASVIFCVFLTESMRVRSSRREHRTTRPERGAELPRRWVVEALLASAEEDQAVERWEHDMAAAAGPRRRGSPAGGGARGGSRRDRQGRGRNGREGNGFGRIGFGWRGEHGGVFKPS